MKVCFRVDKHTCCLRRSFLKRAASDGACARSDWCAVLVRGAAELRRSVAAAAFCERGGLACLKRGGGNEGGHGQGEESLDLHFEMCNNVVLEMKKSLTGTLE